ncbi:hypothetical protein BOX15_Mlig027391g1 [Macrostomum lignano]|uniref:WSC domain-containing protein n=1 Tax=Macrostomum lignano TaxID=282301 RepID=A0A267H5F1_9PLAT|nr:hypothetical protein BOX15_Mlig027391g1 [Macrostomum lignano]
MDLRLHILQVSPDSVGSWVHDDAMTLIMCSKICSLGGFAYFGVQAAAFCFCGWSYGWQGSAPESDCFQTCTGDSSTICGGQNRNSVYAMHYGNNNCKTFRLEASRPQLKVDAATFTQATYSAVGATEATDCILKCNSAGRTCQAAIFNQQARLCHLLRFALMPQALNTTVGDFYVIE